MDQTDGTEPASRPSPTEPARSRFFGHLPQLRRDPLELLLRASREHRPVASLMLVGPVWLLNEPEDIHHVLVTGYKNYPKAAQTERIKPIVGDGLLTSEGEFWRRQRKLAQPAFQKERLSAFASIMSRVAEETVARWMAAPQGATIDVAEAMGRAALRVIGLTMFDRDLVDEAPTVGRALETVQRITTERFRRLLFLPRLPTPANIRFDRAMDELDGLVERIIADRRASGTESLDLLSMFMGTRDADTGEGMTDRQLRDEIMTMLLAGHETTSNALAWTFALLDRHPDAADRIRDEAASVCGDRAVGFEDMRSLRFTRRVIQESMRLYPPVWLFARAAREADTLPSGVRIPAGRMIFVCPYALHRDPAYWPDPDRFDPDRFTDAAIAARPRASYVPFAAGPRRCIGDEFAMTEATIMLATIMRRVRLRLVDGHRPVPEPLVTLRPKYGLPMRVERI